MQQTGVGLPMVTRDMLGEPRAAGAGRCMHLMGWGPADVTHVTLRGPRRETRVGIWDEGPPGGRQEGREETGHGVGTPCPEEPAAATGL